MLLNHCFSNVSILESEHSDRRIGFIVIIYHNDLF